MSGVLDRMAKRTLGQLPGIEPRVAPRFKPSAAPLMEHLVEHEARMEGSASAIPAVRAEQRMVRSIQAQPPSSPSSPPHSTRLNTSVEPDMDRFAKVGSAGEAIEEPIAGTLASEHLNEGSSSAHAQPSLSFEARDEASTSTIAPPAYNGPTAISEARLVHSQPVQSFNEPAAATNPSVQQTINEQSTEIHISIGSIELRAPRTEPVRRPPPFRPGISLEDYLRGRQGAR